MRNRQIFKKSELGKIPVQWNIDTMENSLDSIIDYRGKTPQKSELGIKTLSAKSVKDGYIDYQSAYHISRETYKRFMVRGIPKKGDILMTTEAPLGLVAKLDRDDVAIAQRLLTLRGKADYLDNNYLMYYLKSRIGQHQLNIRASGTTVTGIKQSEFRKVFITLPPIEEQESIAKILSDLDEKIEINNRLNDNLEKIANAIFKQWFVDFEFPNEDGKPYKSNGGEMVESEMGMIPKGWEVIAFSEIMKISSGKRPTKKSSDKTSEFLIPLTGASSIMGYVKEHNYNEPILVIGRVGTHGIVQRFNDKVWASDNTLVITSQYHEFSYQMLNRIDYTALNRGSTQPLITQTDIKKQKIVIGKLNLLNEFERIVGDIFNSIYNNNKEIEQLISLRNTLLPKLMSGEIRVPFK
ncbi:restriction endonuclease subunit S [Clostridium botulinum]|uniref:restriction endonuclease subunit S n=1 Tax=Clostridium botulinum TaxID=1491 RepID=UPI0019677D70|nr:restriction endonuclease subunit S [Clostridium botulinum]MBN1071693.1 restriction endonuclease subunit S [Clostridium botulinum]